MRPIQTLVRLTPSHIDRTGAPLSANEGGMNTQAQRVALITGGSRGLGRNTAESLARKGVDVVITYHSRVDEARTVVGAIEAQGRKAVALQLDAAAVATFDRFTETFKS